MSARTERDRVLSRGDAAAMGFFMLLGGAFAVATVVASVVRIIEVLANDGVRVYAEFAGTTAVAPIGPDGAAVPVELDTAFLTVPSLPAASVGALVIEQIIIAATVMTVVLCLLLVVFRVLRGEMFSRVNTRLVTTAGIVGLVGVALAPFFGNMGANGAFARLSDRTFDNVVLAVDPVMLVGVAFLAAIGATTFTVGARLQRDTAGLV